MRMLCSTNYDIDIVCSTEQDNGLGCNTVVHENVMLVVVHQTAIRSAQKCCVTLSNILECSTKLS